METVVKLGDGIVKTLVTKLLKKAIKKSTGCDVDISLGTVDLTVADGNKAVLDISAKITAEAKDLLKLVGA